MKNILILGGAGFIGLNLSIYLKNLGYNVSALDTLSKSNMLNALRCVEQYNIDLIRRDALDINFIVNLVKNYNVVINLISSDIVHDGFSYQETLSKLSILTTQILMQAASKYESVQKVILASNLHVYGEAKPYRSSYKETLDNLEPVNMLGAIKLSEEIISKTLAKAYEQKLVILRISECFGEHLRMHMPYSNIMKMAVSCLFDNHEYVFPNDGVDRRDYIFVEDVCWYIEKIISTKQENLIETYNVCSGTETSFLDVYEYIKKFYEIDVKKGGFDSVSYPFLGHIVGDNSKINKRFGKHYTSFNNGMDKTLEWIRSALKEQNELLSSS